MPRYSRLLLLAVKALSRAGASRASGRPGKSSAWQHLALDLADRLLRPAEDVTNARNGTTRTSGTLSREDRDALAKYDYLLRTAPSQDLERIHREAFERLTDEQRGLLLERLRDEMPTQEHPGSTNPDVLARSATRGETLQPGLMRRVLTGIGTRRPSKPGMRVRALALGGLAVAVAGGAAASIGALPLISQAIVSGVNFDQLAGGLGDAIGTTTSFVGDVAILFSNLGSDISLPGLGDLFG